MKVIKLYLSCLLNCKTLCAANDGNITNLPFFASIVWFQICNPPPSKSSFKNITQDNLVQLLTTFPSPAAKSEWRTSSSTNDSTGYNLPQECCIFDISKLFKLLS